MTKDKLPAPKTQIELNDAYISWLKGAYKAQRFGQWLINTFSVDKEPWWELYYEEDQCAAYKLYFEYMNQLED